MRLLAIQFEKLFEFSGVVVVVVMALTAVTIHSDVLLMCVSETDEALVYSEKYGF